MNRNRDNSGIYCVADDLGMSREINHAILHSHTFGVLHAAALMMGQSATAEGVELARSHPDLEVGWHLHLNDSKPLTLPKWPWGDSPARAGWSIGLFRSARAVMRREIIAQWEAFQATGLACRFVNCHHHLHAHPIVYGTLREILGPDFPGWIRLGRFRTFPPLSASSGKMKAIPFQLGAALLESIQTRRRRLSPYRATDTLWGVDRTFRMNAPEVLSVLPTLGPGFHEFLFHPRTLTCPDTVCLIELRSSAAFLT